MGGVEGEETVEDAGMVSGIQGNDLAASLCKEGRSLFFNGRSVLLLIPCIGASTGTNATSAMNPSH